MIINNKKIFKSLSHNNKYILIDEHKNKINIIDKEIVKKELFEELKSKIKDTAKLLKEFKDKKDTIWYEIETVYVEYNPYNPSELYIKGGFYYYNMFKNTPVRKKMLEIHEEYKKKGKLIDNVLDIVNKFPHVNLLFDSLTNFNEKYKQYILNWLAYVFITHKRTLNTIIFKGVEGTGKGLLYDHIIKKVFYENQTTVISNTELNSEFNEFLENKSFIIANEIQDYTNKKSVYEKLKQWITDETTLLNVKHINRKNTEILTNFLIYSNNDYPIPITATDRRYSVINTSDVKLEILCQEKLGIDIFEFVDNYKKETEDFLYELSKYNFSEKEARQLLYNKDREYIIFNTEEKTKILKDKLKNLDKEFFLVKYPTEYLFDVEEKNYFNITSELGLGNINNNIEETHKQIIAEVFEAIETKNFIPTNYIKYLLYFMYYEQKELKELTKYIGKIGEKTKKTIWFKNTAHRGIIIKPIINKKIQEIKTLEEELKEENKKLKKENEELKKEIKNLKQDIYLKEKEFNMFKKLLLEKGILDKETLNKLEADLILEKLDLLI